MAGTDDLSSPVLDGASGVGAHRAVGDQSSIGLSDDDVGLAITRIRVGGALANRDLAGRAELDGSAGGGGRPALVEVPTAPPALVVLLAAARAREAVSDRGGR